LLALSVITHFESFKKVVLDSRHLIFFFVVDRLCAVHDGRDSSGTPRRLTNLRTDMKKKPIETILYSAVGVAAMFVLLTGFNIVTTVFKQRMDLTKERAYTLSEGPRPSSRKIDTPVKIRFLLLATEKRHAGNGVSTRVMPNRLRICWTNSKQYAGGKTDHPETQIHCRIRTPKNSANSAALKARPSPPTASPLPRRRVQYARHEAVPLPFLSPSRERMLEYDLARAISQVITPQKPVVGRS